MKTGLNIIISAAETYTSSKIRFMSIHNLFCATFCQERFVLPKSNFGLEVIAKETIRILSSDHNLLERPSTNAKAANNLLLFCLTSTSFE